MPTMQETFDAVVNGLRAQGKPAFVLDDNGSVQCKYRTPDGCKCAAGQLIPDEDYDPEFEGVGVSNAEAGWEDNDGLSALLFIRLGHYYQLVAKLQFVHDDWAGEWNDNLDHPSPEPMFEGVARQFNLIYTPVAA